MGNAASSDLFDLIKSMDKGEKRYFKLYSERQVRGEQNAYIPLYEAMLKTDEYDEKEFIKKHKNIISNSYKDQKKHLYERILRSNSLYHYKTDVDIKNYNTLGDIQLLIVKGLREQANKIIEKALSTNIYLEKFVVILELLKLKRQVLFLENDRKDFSEKIQIIESEEKHFTLLNLNLAESTKIYDAIYSIFLEDRELKSNKSKLLMESIASNKLITGENSSLSISAKINYHKSHRYYALLIADLNANYFHSIALCNYAQSHTQLFKKPTLTYLDISYQVMESLLNLNEFNKEKDMLAEIKEIKTAVPEERAIKYLMSHDMQMGINIISGDFILASDLEQGFIDAIKQHRKFILKESIAIQYFNLAYAMIGAEKFTKAKKYILLIINDRSILSFPDTYFEAKLLSLLIHYELEDYDYIEYFIKKETKIFMSKNENKMGAILFSFFKKVIQPEERKKIQTHYETLFNELEKSPPSPRFCYLEWVKSKLENCSLAEVVKRNLVKK